MFLVMLQGSGQVPHRKQRGDRGEIAQRVDQEADRDSYHRDEHAGNRRADDRGGIEDRRVQGDGVHQVLLAHHLDLEGLPGGHVESVDHAGRKSGDHHHPVARVTCGTQHEQSERRHDERRLRDQEDGSLAIAIRDHAGERAADEDRQELCCQGDADEQSAVRELQRQPRQRDRLHPGADGRNDLAEQEQTVVAVTERTEDPGRRGVD